MNPTITAMLRLTTAIAETHDNPTPLFKLWKAITETENRDLMIATHKMINNTLVNAVTKFRELADADIEPYSLDESTLLDQIIADLGDSK